MPAPPDRQPRRRAGALAIGGAVLLVVAIVVALLSPTLFGSPPANEAAGTLDTSEPALPLPSPTATAVATLTTPPIALSPTRPLETTPVRDADGIESLENEVVALTNTERTKRGCAPLTLDVKLRKAARNHSAEMANARKLTHTGTNGSDPGARMTLAGYNPSGGWAENVAAGYPTPDAVMTGWMNSEGHRANILNCSMKSIGVGAARATNGQLYWTQDLGGR
jgi:uncharacterized protein YkwD